MTVFYASGDILDIPGTASNALGNLNVANCINTITGAMGPVTVRMLNLSNAENFSVYFCPSDVTYTFTNQTGVASGSGANAVFNVTASINGYSVEIVDAGDGYVVTETETIDGSNLGGITSTNDCVITVDSVDGNGAITSTSVAGTPVWPQGTLPNTFLLPLQEVFLQVNNGTPQNMSFVGYGVSGNLFIQAVQIVS